MSYRHHSHTDSDTLGERFIIAFFAAFVAALTLVLAPLFTVFLLGYSPIMELWGLLLSKVGLAFVAVSAVVGFFVGTKTISDFFALVWGTHELWENDRFIFAALSVFIVCIGAFIAYFWY